VFERYQQGYEDGRVASRAIQNIPAQRAGRQPKKGRQKFSAVFHFEFEPARFRATEIIMIRMTMGRAVLISQVSRPATVTCYREDPYDFVKNPKRNMGGLGPGRTHRVGAAGKVEHWRSIDLADLRRMGLLKPITGGRIRAIMWNVDGWLDKLGVIPEVNGVRFIKRDKEGQLRGLFVAYAVTPTMFGGSRKWFQCPGCRRPSRILYGEHSLRCRRCRRLKYASQSEAPPWRAQRRARNIRRRLGTSGDALDAPFPPKPRRMHWSTYKRLRSLDGALQDRWLVGMMAIVGKFDGRLKRS
jgi:hypothetical protein